jgi:hypothetical protein
MASHNPKTVCQRCGVIFGWSTSRGRPELCRDCKELLRHELKEARHGHE